MDGLSNPFPTRSTRLGFHYFPDALHYRESDLSQWLPELSALGISWLVIKSPLDRAIPENFIQGLLQAGIEPLVDFDLPLSNPTPLADLVLLFKAYARWGVRGITLFNRPNSFQAWSKSTWARQDLVERFLDRYLPVASAAVDENLVPLFPLLEPGGSYWDTSFFHSLLNALLRRNPPALLDQLVISVNACSNHHDLNWGAGGAHQWPSARPYFTPAGSQDQLGFRAYDWYRDIALATLKREVPIIMFNAGLPSDPNQAAFSPFTSEEHLQTNYIIARLLEREPVDSIQPLPECVLAGCFGRLAADAPSPAGQTWFDPQNGYPGTIHAIKTWRSHQKSAAGAKESLHHAAHPIRHYLLLPTFDWGIPDWHLDVIKPFVKKYRATVGFSLDEAALAGEVTIVGGADAFSDDQVENLVLAGCIVHRVVGNGTSIATQLAER